MTANKRFEKLLNRFGQTASDLPIAELGPAYREYYLESLVERMEIALQIASECIESVHKRASLISEGFRPLGVWTYQNDPMYNLGFKDAGSAIVKLMDAYSVHRETNEEEQK